MAYVFNPFTGKLDAILDPVVDPFTFIANCDSSDAVGQCVYVSADSIGGVFQVTKVDPTNPAKMPAIGIITIKTSPTDCTVSFFGVILSSGLSPNARYFVDVTSYPTSSVPAARPVILQELGRALDSTRLLLIPSNHLLRLNP